MKTDPDAASAEKLLALAEEGDTLGAMPQLRKEEPKSDPMAWMGRLSGFVGKWTLGSGMAQAGGFGHLAVILLGSLLAAVYLWPVIYRIWQRPEDGDPMQDGPSADVGRERRRWMLFAVLAAGCITIALGVAAGLPGFPLELARLAADQLLGVSAWK